MWRKRWPLSLRGTFPPIPPASAQDDKKPNRVLKALLNNLKIRPLQNGHKILDLDGPNTAFRIFIRAIIGGK
jgi:hypothetical protein